MSKIKSPDEKKRKSYEKDRRNCYGENSKAGRKSIPLGKQRAHRNERRIASEALNAIGHVPVEEVVDAAEGNVKERLRLKRLAGFKKVPDKPLGEMLKRREARKARLAKNRNRAEN